MIDYKNMQVQEANHISTFVALGVLVVLIGLLASSCVDGIVKTVDIDQEQARKRRTWTVEQTYRKPSAYRLHSPTQAEMDHLHGIMTVMEVDNAR